MKPLPHIVIIGRINVGKSALFNRLTESSKAIVSRVPGTTRDYNKATVGWQKKMFTLIDTGGVDSELVKDSIASLISKKIEPKAKTNDPIEIEIVKQTRAALEQAQLVLLVVDVQTGIMPQDKQLAQALQKTKLPIVLVCNKADSPKWKQQAADFFSLGINQLVAVSAANGSGTGDLLDIIVKYVKAGAKPTKTTTADASIRVAIIGKPNVGKSSLVNQILGEQRVIVSPIAQTTREPQDTELLYKDHHITIIDTAGLRKRTKIGPGIEKAAARKTLAMIKSADVTVFVTEAHIRLSNQESHLAGLIKGAASGVVIVGNKWDLIKDKAKGIDKEMITYYRRFFPYLDFAPLIFISALTGKNVEKILDLIIAVHQQRKKIISPDELNIVAKKIVSKHSPKQAKGSNRPRIYRFEQTKNNPPIFTVTIGKEQSLHFSYLRFIENQLRQNFDFSGVPITIKVKTLKN